MIELHDEGSMGDLEQNNPTGKKLLVDGELKSDDIDVENLDEQRMQKFRTANSDAPMVSTTDSNNSNPRHRRTN